MLVKRVHIIFRYRVDTQQTLPSFSACLPASPPSPTDVHRAYIQLRPDPVANPLLQYVNRLCVAAICQGTGHIRKFFS